MTSTFVPCKDGWLEFVGTYVPGFGKIVEGALSSPEQPEYSEFLGGYQGLSDEDVSKLSGLNLEIVEIYRGEGTVIEKGIRGIRILQQV